jgi:hypothetical protein
MTGLNPLLDLYAPPEVPDGLAQRVAAAAATAQQERSRAVPWPRGTVRGWRRGTLIASAAVGLIFTSAVAAEVVSGGRIEIPVVHQVVAAIPVLSASSHRAESPLQLASRTMKPAQKPEAVSDPQSQPRATPRERAVERFDRMKQKAAERRAAGLPTPNADRIERKAIRIVERREAAGLPVPSLDEVEMRVAFREWRTMRILRQVARDPSGITDVQVARLARILPAQKRAQFLALGPDQQRVLIGQSAQRFLERRMRAQALAAASPPVAATEQASEQPRTR